MGTVTAPTTAINLSTYGTTLGTVSGAVTVPIYGVPASRLGTSDAQTVDVLTSVQVSGYASTSRDLAVFSSLNTPTTAINLSTYGTTLGTVSGAVTVPIYGVPASRLGTSDAQTVD